MAKITVVGAGNVGATCANVLAFNEVADEIVLLDIKEGVSEGKALDMMQTATLLGFDTKINGVTNDYTKTAGSDVVVITSGIPRKPGMTREVNAGIVKTVTESVLAHSPNAIIVCVSNPMDTMTYLIQKTSGLPKNRIIGMGGALDSSRFKCYLSKALNANPNEIEGVVIGGHGDTTMIPLSLGNIQRCTRYPTPRQRSSRQGCCRHDGRWRYAHQNARDIGMVRTGCSGSLCSRSHYPRPEKSRSLQCLSRRRVRRKQHLYRRSRRFRPHRLGKSHRLQTQRRRNRSFQSQCRSCAQDQQRPQSLKHDLPI